MATSVAHDAHVKMRMTYDQLNSCFSLSIVCEQGFVEILLGTKNMLPCALQRLLHAVAGSPCDWH